MLLLRSVAGTLWRAVRRPPGPSPVAGPRYLTIGVVVMNQNNAQTPAPRENSSTHRQMLEQAILLLASDVIVARFALVRAMDGLDYMQLNTLLDEVGQTLQPRAELQIEQKTTLRDENL